MNSAEVIKFAEENECKFVDLKFIDLPGTWLTSMSYQA